MLTIWLSCLLFLFSSTLAQNVTVPSQDPFYQPPHDFECKEPGTILRSRPIAASNTGFVPVPVQAFQLLYRTQSTNGTAIAAVTTVLVPNGAKRDRFVSWQVAEDSSFVDCAPSYALQQGSESLNPSLTTEFIIVQIYLARGYIVSVPDHEGPDAAFSAGRLEGLVTLDSMRAVSKYLGDKPAIVGAGYSGGAIPSGWAAQMQSTYAPELNIKGWAIGAVPANLTGALLNVDGTFAAGLLPIALGGLLKPSAYGHALSPVFEKILTTKGHSQLDFDAKNCALADLVSFANQRLLSTDFQTLGANLTQDPTFRRVLERNTMGTNARETPVAPVFLSHSELDEVLPYSNTSQLYDQWCKNGANVHFTTFETGSHAQSGAASIVPGVLFADAVFGSGVNKGCSKELISTLTVDTSALGPALETLLDLVKSVLPS